MKNGYELMSLLSKTLESNTLLINTIVKEGKNSFSSNDEHILISIGILTEIKNIFDCIDKDFFILNKKIFDTLLPIVNYSRNLFNNYGVVNSYKLYDSISVDLLNLKKLLKIK